MRPLPLRRPSTATRIGRPPSAVLPHDETSLGPGTSLGITPLVLTSDMDAQYLRDIREADPIYEEEGLAHPGQLLRLCNLVLRQNVALPPWLHVGSKVTND
jgi:hypothetical protein